MPYHGFLLTSEVSVMPSLLGHDRTSAVTEGFYTPPDFQSEFAAESLTTESGQAGAGRVNYVDEPCGMIPFIPLITAHFYWFLHDKWLISAERYMAHFH
jgi:hypothetical protein